jgi:hypothetical protein
MLHHILNKNLKKQGIIASTKTNNNIGRVLTAKNKSNSKFDRTGINKIKCTDCSMFYVGQTGRSFNTRLKEHLPKTNNNLKSLVSPST